MKMSNKTYDALKAIAQVIIPVTATAYWVLSEFVGVLPAGESVVGALVAIDTCLGSVLAYSTHEYNKEEDEDEISPLDQYGGW